jgi:hypothetical protein
MMSKPTPQDEQNRQIAEVNAKAKKLGIYGEVSIFKDNYDTVLPMTLDQAVQSEDETDGGYDWSLGKTVRRTKE